MIGNYNRADVIAYMNTAFLNNLRMYVQYFRKKDNVLRILEVRPTMVYDDYTMVIDTADSQIKRLNHDRVYKLAIEVPNA